MTIHRHSNRVFGRYPVACTLALALLAWCGPAAPQALYDGASMADLERVRNGVLLPVSIGGSGPYPFALDLGVQRIVVDQAFAEALQLPRAEGEGETTAAASGDVVALERFAIADGPAFPERALIMDLASLSNAATRPVYGIVPGYQPGRELSLDLASRIVAWRPLGVTTLDAAPGAHTIPLRLDLRRGPMISLQPSLSPEPLEVALDMAQTEVAGLPEAMVTEANLPILDIPGAFGAPSRKLVRIPAITVAGLRYEAPLVRVVPSAAEAFAGAALLEPVRLVLNFEYGRARFDPRQVTRFETPPMTGYGLLPDRPVEGGWRVLVAIPSPAHEAGLESGCLVSHIDGFPVAEAPLADLEAVLFPQGDASVELQGRCDGILFDLRVEATRLI